MHLTTLTTLLLPLLLSSVLAAPTPTGHDNANGGPLKVRQCGPGISAAACAAAEKCSPNINAANSCYQQEQEDDLMAQPEAEEEANEKEIACEGDC